MMPFSAAAYSPASSSRTPSSSSSSPWIRKPLAVVRRQESQHNNNSSSSSSSPATNRLHRHLTLIDLLGIGVGGTVGSGIFVLTGQIAAQYAGKACWLSLGVAGAAACLSGACYAELSSRIPAAGSTYVYAYVCWGELAAVAAAACLTLEVWNLLIRTRRRKDSVPLRNATRSFAHFSNFLALSLSLSLFCLHNFIRYESLVPIMKLFTHSH